MKHIIIGTAGHVDHGKTALVKALTGIDTDRLREEKERGISIELGFASLALQKHRTYGIIDVPGHERFIKNMVSGASGIDMVILVIAADEGVMPQTREHLDICALLGIRKGLVALTKTDIVEEDWLQLVTDDVHVFLKGTFLESSPVIPVSSLTGHGLQELKNAIAMVASETEKESDAGLFRLPIDRVFTMKGFGTVITGTLIAGEIRVGEEVEILPKRNIAKVRGIQIHSQAAIIAETGQRTAINLQGIDRESVERGDVLARPGTLRPSNRLDIHVEYLPVNEKKLKNRSLVRFHTGTVEVIGRIILLGREQIEPGDKDYAQVVFASPVVTVAKDRFVIRSYSPVTTIGGGAIIDPLPRKYRRSSEKTKSEYDRLLGGTDHERVLTIIERSGIDGLDIRELVVRTGIHENLIRTMVESLCTEKHAVLLDTDEFRVVSLFAYQNFQNRIRDEIRTYHERNSLKEGIAKEELRNTIGQFLTPRLFNMAIRDLEKKGEIVVEKEIVRMSTHRVDLKGELGELRNRIAALYSESGLTPPTIKEVMERFAYRKAAVESVLNVMVREGKLIKISEDLYFSKEVLFTLRENYKNLLMREGKATPLSFKGLTNLSRKYIIPLMEYFDATKLTIRTGEYRILREK
jgi:selenocysteine-specific elongation factor